MGWRFLLLAVTVGALVLSPGQGAAASIREPFCPERYSIPEHVRFELSGIPRGELRRAICRGVEGLAGLFPDERERLRATIYVTLSREKAAEVFASLTGRSRRYARDRLHNRSGMAFPEKRAIIIIAEPKARYAPTINVVAHELAHVLQRYRGDDLMWMKEGAAMFIASAVSDKVDLPQERGLAFLAVARERGAEGGLPHPGTIERRVDFRVDRPDEATRERINYLAGMVAFDYLIGGVDNAESGLQAYYECYLRGRGGFSCFGFSSKRDFYRAYEEYVERGYVYEAAPGKGADETVAPPAKVWCDVSRRAAPPRSRWCFS